MDTTAIVNPKKFEPVSPIKVLAGLKLNGKNPVIAPANAVINTMAIIGEPFNAKMIKSEIAEIIVIPEESPSNPSIRLIALVIPTIHKIVIIMEKGSLNPNVLINGIFKNSIFIPQITTIMAAASCPANFTNGLIPLVSSTKQVPPSMIIPIRNPNSFNAYCSSPNKSMVPSILRDINK